MIEFMDNLPLKDTYWYITVPATILFLFLMLGSFFGLGEDMDTDTDLDDIDDVDGGFPIFTFRNFATFFTFLGWGGLIALKNGTGHGMSVVVGTICGLVMVGIVTSIFFVFNKLREDNTSKLSDTINSRGSVYLTIPPKGKGKVNVVLNGAHQTIEASSKDGSEIKTGTPITVLEVVGTELIVEQI